MGFIKSQPGSVMGIMEADMGQGKLGIPSDHFFQLLRVIMAQAGQYVGAVGHLEGASCRCGISQCHREMALHLKLWLAVFTEAVSGSRGVFHHGLHWCRFTGVFNTKGFSERHWLSLSFCFYCLVWAAIREVIHDEVKFCLPYPLDLLLILWGASLGHISNRFSLDEVTAQREKKLTDNNQVK